MSMPASGCLGINECPNAVACTSISMAVCNTVAGSLSLSTLAACAGKSCCMTAFYGYDNFVVTPTTTISIPAAGCTVAMCVCGPAPITYTTSTACAAMLVPAAPVTIAPAGVATTVLVCANEGIARSSVVCYTPSYGTIKCATFCQLCGTQSLFFTSLCSVSLACCACRLSRLDGMCVAGNCACLCLGFEVKKCGVSTTSACALVYCCGALKYSCCLAASTTCTVVKNGVFTSFLVNCTTPVCVCTKDTTLSITYGAAACINICAVTGVVGSYCKGTPNVICAIIGTPPA